MTLESGKNQSQWGIFNTLLVTNDFPRRVAEERPWKPEQPDFRCLEYQFRMRLNQDFQQVCLKDLESCWMRRWRMLERYLLVPFWCYKVISLRLQLISLMRSFLSSTVTVARNAVVNV